MERPVIRNLEFIKSEIALNKDIMVNIENKFKRPIGPASEAMLSRKYVKAENTLHGLLRELELTKYILYLESELFKIKDWNKHISQELKDTQTELAIEHGVRLFHEEELTG